MFLQCTFSKNNTLYIQLEDRESTLEILKRGGIARKKNPELKITNFIPPQVFDRHIAAMNFCREQRESNPDILLTVRLGESDIKILMYT